jgi:ATP-dependent helicase HrpA
VIAAALSIQDPRERPRDKAQAAQEHHIRFETTDSDFLAFVRMWDYIADLQSQLSGNQFRKRCRAEFLNVLRVREWQDVASQLRQVQRSEGIHANRDPGEEAQVHRSLMAGLLSHLGMRDPQRGDYEGARNSRWQISRDSPLARKRPSWAMAGTLVETERTWARTIARVDPAWAESAGAHVSLRSYSDAWWDRRRCEALVSERVTLYGLPIVDGRKVSLSRVDRPEAREMFIRGALVDRETNLALVGLDRTDELVGQLEELSRRARRADLLADSEALYRFYDSCIPDDVTSGRRFERWWGREQRRHPQLLDVPLAALLATGVLPVKGSDYPDRWTADGLEMPLRYVYEPGAPDDGVTVEVPVGALNRLRAADFEWQVPGRRRELISMLVRLLPKSARGALPPPGETADVVLESTGPADGPLLPAVASILSKLSGQAIGLRAWANAEIPEHLRVSFEVRGMNGEVLATSRHLPTLQISLAEATRSALAQLAPGVEVRGAVSWEFGELPRQIDNGTLRAYPGLADEGATVGVRLYDTPSARAEGMWQGTRRLLLLDTPLPPGHVDRRLSRDTKLVLARSGVKVSDLLRDCALALADQVLIAHGGPSFDQLGFEEMRSQLADGLTERVAGLATIAGGVLAAADRVLEIADRLEKQQGAPAIRPAVEDVRQQVQRLVTPGFVSSAGPDRLSEMLRYMEAARIRLGRLRTDVRRDAGRQQVVERIQSRYDTLLERVASGNYQPSSAAALAEIRWSIEELRVSLWAQSLGTAGPISEQRIDRALDALDL